MKCASAILALAATAIAVPTASNSCSTTQTNIYCCGLLGLLCSLNVLGSCGGSSYCCDTTYENPQLSIISANCLKIG
ncbi:hypothetical protein E4U53_005397 [Claviceps sorghi]|nr:hypothetical protein E4U53_005397 [Claviceps sorghi]